MLNLLQALCLYAKVPINLYLNSFRKIAIRIALQRANKMENKKTEPTVKDFLEAEFPSELSAPRWAVITFEKCVAKNLSYEEAARKLAKLKRQKISGLCIVSDEAAGRIKTNS